MLLLLIEWFRQVLHWKIPAAFGYFSTRMMLAAATSLLLTIFLGPRFIKKLYELKIGQPIRSVEEVPLLAELHGKKKDTPTMGGISFINDAYNANPESMRAALSSLPMPKEGGKRIAVLGTMKELGTFSENAHREVGKLAQRCIDHLLVLGDEATPLCDAFTEVKKPGECFVDHKSLAERLTALMSPGDVVLVKGSRSMRMETIFDLLR